MYSGFELFLNQAEALYGVSDYATPEEFLAIKAQKQGRYKKGGIPDVRLSAKMLIDDWNRYLFTDSSLVSFTKYSKEE